ncbi:MULTISPECIES: helix-turn-helix transcriptional regulator [unclassified Nocardia]|uniref:helix-turn-helix domain-containing protein n=1 Tax=unclassified Nocardia TaxID=2637762 RepID=UPI0024A8EDFB|nr:MULTISPECIES: helix-turn-helix transcriptional regulator [unclassified Nocardia]
MSTATASDPALPRRQLGTYLRELRNENGLTIAEAAKLMQWTPSMLQRLETAKIDGPRDADIRELCRIYDADTEKTEALIGLAHQANEKSWWHEYGDVIRRGFDMYIGLEGNAEGLRIHQSDLVPGLLQTGDYARAIISSDRAVGDHEETARRVQLRLRRQKSIMRAGGTRVDAIIGEATLRRVMGSRKVMIDQLRHLDQMSTKPNISLRVLPFSAGCPAGEPLGSFVILDFRDDERGRPTQPTVVYLEGFTGELYLEKRPVVARFQKAFEDLRSSALTIQDSRNFLRHIIREHERAA